MPESRWLRNRLLLLMGLTLGAGAVALAADVGAFPRGPSLTFFDFGRDVSYDLVEWAVSLVFWALWFLLALWCIAFGVRAQRPAYVNTGVLGVGLGVLTRFFDLVGSLQETGLLFIGGGLLLLGTGWAAERWRRALMARMGDAT